MIGFAKDIPAAAMRALTLERVVMVRDALIAKGLPDSRSFLGAPSLHEAGAVPGQAWAPYADVQLSAH